MSSKKVGIVAFDIGMFLFALVSWIALEPSDAAHAQTERQTKLILPKMVPEAKPVLVAQTGLNTLGCIVFSPDGKKLALASGGYTSSPIIMIWDVETAKVARVLRGHTTSVRSLAFSADGGKLASGSADGTVKIWEISRGKAEVTLSVHAGLVRWVCFGANGNKVLCASIPNFVPGATISIWDLPTGREENRWTIDPPNIATSMCLSPDGRTLASGLWDSTVVLWDVDTGEAEKTLQGHPTRVTSVSFSPDGTKVASGSAEGTVIVCNAKTGSPERTFNELSYVGCVAFSPVGTRLAASSRTHAIIWNVETGKPEQKIQFPGQPRSIAFSPDGSTLALGGSSGPFSHIGKILLCDAQTGQVLSSWEGTGDRIQSVSWSADGSKLVWNSVFEGVTVWDLRSGRVESAMPHGGDVAYDLKTSRDGRKVATPGIGVVKVWNLGSDVPPARLPAHPGNSVLSVAFSPTGEKLASGSFSEIVIWNLGASEQESTLVLPPSDFVSERMVNALAFSPDGGMLASGLASGTVALWDLKTRKMNMILRGHSGGVNSLSFSPDGNHLASASSDQTVIIWRVRSGRLDETLRGHTGSVYGVSFSLDGRMVASASDDGTIVLWDVGTWKARRVLFNGAPVDSVSFSPGGSVVACSMFEHGVKLWDIPRGAELALVATFNDGRDWLETTPQGYYRCSLEAAGMLVWRLGDNIYPFDQFEEKFHRPDLVRKALAGEDISDAPPLDGTQIPPNVVFTSPEYGAEVTGDDVEVTVEVAGVYPIKRVDLTINGRTVPMEVARALEVERPKEKERVFRVAIPLPPNEPQVRLRAVAYDTELLKSRPAELFLRRAGIPEQPGKLFVLAIGLSRYKTQAWNTLQYSDDDALAFAEAFAKQQGSEYEKVEKRVLTNEEATVSNVKFALRELKDTVAEGDVAVVFVAGHGIEEAGDYYFLCHDTTEADLANTALPWQDFVNVLREVRAKRVLLFADTCHAGFVTGWRTTDTLIDRLNRKAGVLVFAASRGEEASIERDDWGHGAFTKAVLEALEGAADKTPKDGRVTLQELRDSVIPRVEELTNNQQHAYLPRLQDFEPEAVIAKAGR